MFTKSFIRALSITIFGLLFTFQAQAGLKIEQWQTSSGSLVYFVENHD